MAKKDAQPLSYAVWATAWGPMGAVASPAGLRRVVLPHYQFDEIAQLLEWEHPGCTRDETPLADLIQLSRDYFNGKCASFDHLACECLEADTFQAKVLRACRSIPYGQTRSYGGLARQIGQEDAARAVAGALGKNPVGLVVPCHRVTYADGRAGGFSAPAGVELKRRMLALEAGARA